MPLTGSPVTLSQNRAYSVNRTRLALYFFLGLTFCQGVFLYVTDDDIVCRGSAFFCVVRSSVVARVLFLWRHLSTSECDGPRRGLVASHSTRTYWYSVVGSTPNG